LDLPTSKYGPLSGSWEHGNEASGSVKGGGIFDNLSDDQLLEMELLHGVRYRYVA